MILRSVSGDANVTQIDDHGFVEFYPPGKPEDITRCFYKVRKGLRLSDLLVRYIRGEIRVEGDIDRFLRLIE